MSIKQWASARLSGPRYTTKAQDMAFLAKRFGDASKKWKVGDECMSYKGNEVTKVSRIDGPIIYLANGDSMHVSKMKSVK